MRNSLRLFLALVLLLVPLTIFGGEQKPATPSGPTQITFMTPLAGADGAYMDQIIQGFNAANPDVEVVHLVMGSSPEMKQRLSTGLVSKTAPEVMLMRKFDMPLYLDQFVQFSKSDLSGYGINIDDVFPNLLEGLTVGSRYVGIPLDVWIFYTAYNKANFRAAGLDPENFPMTRDAFVSAMKKLVPLTPEGITPYYETPTWTWIFFHLLWQFGGDVLTDDFKSPAFMDAGTQVLRFMKELQADGIMPTAAVDAGGAFLSGESSVLITGIWTINPWLEELGDDFGYAVAPQLGTTNAVFGGSHVIAIPEIMVQDPAKKEAAMRWVKYLWDHMIEWYAAGQTPSRMSIASSTQLREELPQIYKVAQQLQYVKSFQMFPNISEVEAEIAVYLEAALITGEMTPEQAMSEAADAVQLVLDDYWAGQ